MFAFIMFDLAFRVVGRVMARRYDRATGASSAAALDVPQRQYVSAGSASALARPKPRRDNACHGRARLVGRLSCAEIA